MNDAAHDPLTAEFLVMLGLMERRLDGDQVQRVHRALTRRDAETGDVPEDAAAGLDDERAREVEIAVRAWLTLTDSQLWTNLSLLFARETELDEPRRRAVLALARDIRQAARYEKLAVRAHQINWPIGSRLELALELAKLGPIAEMCDYMSTYRSAQGMPPFSLGADLVLAALEQLDRDRVTPA
jgi:hypothetical protein